MHGLTPNQRLERASWDSFWVPADVVVVDRPELLMLSCPRPMRMLNVVLRADAEPRQLDALVAEASEAHAHTSSRWFLPDTRVVAPYQVSLARGGYEPGHRHEARGIDVASFAPRSRGSFRVRAVVDLETARHDMLVANHAFGRGSVDENDLTHDLALCTGPHARNHCFVAYDGDTPVASGGLSAMPELSFGLLWGGGTVPSARGRGAYSAVLAARIARAAELGLAFVGLYARTSSSAPIVAKQGFERWGEMTYWEREPDASPQSTGQG